MDQIGVRELRQNASKYLRRVEAGETIEVTDHGRPVARLIPVEDEGLDALIRAGKAKPASVAAEELLKDPPVKPKKGQRLPSEILEEMRREETR